MRCNYFRSGSSLDRSWRLISSLIENFYNLSLPILSMYINGDHGTCPAKVAFSGFGQNPKDPIPKAGLASFNDRRDTCHAIMTLLNFA